MKTPVTIEVQTPDDWTNQEVRDIVHGLISQAKFNATSLVDIAGHKKPSHFSERFLKCDIEVCSNG